MYIVSLQSKGKKKEKEEGLFLLFHYRVERKGELIGFGYYAVVVAVEAWQLIEIKLWLDPCLE